MRILEPVLIIWKDANFIDEEGGPEDDDQYEPTLVYTCGWLLGKNQHKVSIAIDYFPEDGTWRAVQTIPIGWVEQVVSLTKKGPE